MRTQLRPMPQPDDELAGAGVMFDSGEEGKGRGPSAGRGSARTVRIRAHLRRRGGLSRARRSTGGRAAYTTGNQRREARTRRASPRGFGGGYCAAAFKRSLILSAKAVRSGPAKPDDTLEPDVVVRGIVRERDGHKLVSLFLVNGQISDGTRSVPSAGCAKRLSCRWAASAGAPVFVRRPVYVVGASAGG